MMPQIMSRVVLLLKKSLTNHFRLVDDKAKSQSLTLIGGASLERPGAGFMKTLEK